MCFAKEVAVVRVLNACEYIKMYGRVKSKTMETVKRILLFKQLLEGRRGNLIVSFDSAVENLHQFLL